MSDSVEATAAAWALRHPLDRHDRAELDAWLACDPRHAGALLRAQAALTLIDRAVAPDEAPSLPLLAAPRQANRRWVLAGAGGAIAAALAGMIGWQRWIGEEVTTTRGEIRRLPLADGSVATIDTDSAMRVLLDSQSRRIALQQGQAWFQVAKDRQRPFVVDAGIAQARAVGTAFSVRRTEAGVQVAVTEGTVAVWPSDARGAMTILEAGHFATFAPGQPTPVTGAAPAAIQRSLAWRDGEIALENETLGYAIGEFNRYNRRQIVLADDSLKDERLVGLFQIDNPDEFVAMLATSFDMVATTTPQQIRLTKKNRRDGDGNATS
ncbi:FecR family protein [Sphingomonas sp. XXL09]|uniref:FecR family protein n=1 Tax=Sphingomonas sp. XXL09 TaxID=3457787 RepID=UPI00406BA86F